MKTKNYVNLSLLINDHPQKSENKQVVTRNTNFNVAKIIYHKKMFDLIEAKLIINSNEKEYNTLEFKTNYDMQDEKIKLFNYNVINYNFSNIHRNISISKNIFGVSYRSYLKEKNNVYHEIQNNKENEKLMPKNKNKKISFTFIDYLCGM